jgi:hypothetical protein
MLVLFATTSCTKSVEKEPVPAPSSGPVENNTGSFYVTVSTIAGKLSDHGNAEDGNGADARFWNPTKMIFDHRNSMLYVADGTTIRSVDQQNNVKTYLPLGSISNYNEIMDIDLAPGNVGGTLYAVTKENDLLRIEPNGNSAKTTKIIDRVYGGNATGPLNSVDHLDGAIGVAAGKNGEVYFFNSFWNTLHRATLSSTIVEAFAGKALQERSGNAWPFSDGQGETATFGGSVPDIASDGNGNIYVADFRNDLVRMVTANGIVTSLFQYRNGLGIDKDGPVTRAEANRVTQVAPTKDGSMIFFTTFGDGSNYLPKLRMVRPGQDVVTLNGNNVNYGDGPGKSAGFATVGGIAATPDGKIVYVSEPGKKVIRKVTIQ